LGGYDKNRYIDLVFTEKIFSERAKRQEKDAKISREKFSEGTNLMKSRKFAEARIKFKDVKENTEHYNRAQELMEECWTESMQQLENDLRRKQIESLKFEYDRARHLELKIKLGEDILAIEYDTKIKMHIDALEDKINERIRLTENIKTEKYRKEAELFREEQARISNLELLKRLTNEYMRATEIIDKVKKADLIIKIRSDSKILESYNKLKKQLDNKNLDQELETERKKQEEELAQKINDKLKLKFYESKDLDFRITLGEDILEKGYDASIEKTLIDLKKQKGWEKTQADASKKAMLKERDRIREDLKKREVEELAKIARDNFKNRRFEFAKAMILQGQARLNDSTWERDLLLDINLELSREQEKYALEDFKNSLYDQGVTLYINKNLRAAKSKLKILLDKDPGHQEALKLLQTVNNDIRTKKRVKEDIVEISISKEQTKLEKAQVKRLLNEVLSLYTVGEFEEAKTKAKKILSIDPDNRQAKQYLIMLER